MLRLIFIITIIIVGLYYSLQGPFFILLFYLWNAYFRPELWEWSRTVQDWQLSFLIGTALLFASIPRWGEFKLTKQTALIGLFLLQSTISLLASEDFAWSYRWWTDFAKCLIITWLITILIDDLKKYRIALLVIAFSLGLESVKQGWAQMVLNPGATNNNPILMFGDNNFVAVGMFMLMPIFIALSRTANSKWEQWIHRFCIVGTLYRGISTYSRGGFLAAAAMGLVALWYSPKRFRAAISIAVLVVVVGSVMPEQFWERMESISSAQEDRDGSTRGRLFVWGVARTMVSENPALGVGFNAFQRVYSRYDPSGGAYGTLRSAHSAWFATAAELGYPGLLIFVAIIIIALHSAWKLRGRRKANDPISREISTYAAALQMSLVAYVVGMTFLHGQYVEMFWHLIGLGVVLERLAANAQPAMAAAVATEEAKLRVIRKPPLLDRRVRIPAAMRAQTTPRP